MTEENEQQMEQLFHDHYERMYRLAFAVLHDNDAAKDVVRRTAPDAIHQIIGFYPIKMTVDGENIFVECTQKTSGKMIGRIVDAHQRPIDFANVSLLNVNDSSLITGGVTNENGQFVIPCEASKTIVRVSCVGYHTAINTYNTGKIGSITLKEATINLQKVVVKGHRKTFEMTNDGLVTQVKDTPLSEAGTANDVMAQVPSVYGSDGKYSVYGKGEAIVYVNGRKLTDDGELERISSNLGITKKLKQWTFQLQATDVFRTARNSVFAYGTSMLLDKWNYSDSQAVKLTVSYRFNSVNSKYKGTGAGNEEKNRF